MKINLSPGKHLGKQKSSKPAYSNSVKSQREIMLRVFNENTSLSTMEARNKYGILHPGGRIKELRQIGHKIETYWVSEPDSNGVIHRVGLYVYKGRAS